MQRIRFVVLVQVPVNRPVRECGVALQRAPHAFDISLLDQASKGVIAHGRDLAQSPSAFSAEHSLHACATSSWLSITHCRNSCAVA